MYQKIDLHLHSYYSCDGDYSPAELLMQAYNKGVEIIAITDHNAVKGIPKALRKAEIFNIKVDNNNLKEVNNHFKKENNKLKAENFSIKSEDYYCIKSKSNNLRLRDYNIEREGCKIKVIPGVEIDTNFQEQNLHILGYNIDWQNTELIKVLENILDAQKDLIQRMIEDLQQKGIAVKMDWVLENKNNEAPPGSFTVAQAVLDNPENKNCRHLQKYYNSNKKSGSLYLSFLQDFLKIEESSGIISEYPKCQEIISLIDQIGGKAVLAHPGAYFSPESTQDVSKIKHLADSGLQGIEAFSSYHSASKSEKFRRIAEKFDLIVTSGSDFHGKLKPDITLGHQQKSIKDLRRIDEIVFDR